MRRWKKPSAACKSGHPWTEGDYSIVRWQAHGTAVEYKCCLVCRRKRYKLRTQCACGHRYSPGSFYVRVRGHLKMRVCLQCERDRNARSSEKQKRDRERKRAKNSLLMPAVVAAVTETHASPTLEPWRADYEAAKARALSKVRAA